MLKENNLQKPSTTSTSMTSTSTINNNNLTKNNITKKTKKRSKAFRRIDYALRKAACQIVIAKRRINVRNYELYKKVGVTRPTFYHHYDGPTHIRNVIEHDLYYDFEMRYLKWQKISPFLIILTEFVFEHPIYFRATHQAQDHYLITKILLHHKAELVGDKSNIDTRTFKLYVQMLECIIDNYIEFSDNSRAAALQCAKQMRLLRPKRFW